MSASPFRVAFQGAPGANSDLACRTVFPDHETLACPRFDDVFEAVHNGGARVGMIPVENSIAGRVADIHHLLPTGGLHIIGEYFQKIDHMLMVQPGTRLEEVREVHSHIQALSQCRKYLMRLGADPVVHSDTAGAAADLAALSPDQAKGRAAIASSLAAEMYGLEVLARDVQDEAHNTTRFLIMAPEPRRIEPGSAGVIITSFTFRVRNIPAALYKAMGGFATNGVNMTKLESYMVNGSFFATQFFSEVEGHPDSPGLKRALEELAFFAAEVNILGVYPAHPFRIQAAQQHLVNDQLSGL